MIFESDQKGQASLLTGGTSKRADPLFDFAKPQIRRLSLFLSHDADLYPTEITFGAIQEAELLEDSRQFEFDLVGNLTRRIDRTCQEITYSYDNLYRRTQENWLNGDQSLNRQLSFDYDIENRLTSASDPIIDIIALPNE